MRAATYARYSSSRQRDTSIDDQERMTGRAIEHHGFALATRYADRAESGADCGRTDYQRMLDDAKARKWDVLVVDDLSRLARDEVEGPLTLRRLKFWGVRVISVGDGYDNASKGSRSQAGFRGLMNAIYLEDLAEKTHRGLEGQVLRGGIASAAPYGYRIVAGDKVQLLQIDEAQAKWVRWIFEERAKGKSPREIAHELNRLGVKSAKGGTWAASALTGSRIQQTGLLNSTVYIGRYVWNRCQWVRDPDTKKRTRRMRPPEEWVIAEHPELRIVPQALWEAAHAQTRQGDYRPGRKASTLFSGILRCAQCGGSIVSVNGSKYGCLTAKERGASVCKGLIFARQQADTVLLAHMRQDLLSPYALSKVQAHIAAMLREAHRSSENVKPRLQALEKEIANLVDAMAQVGHSEAIAKRLMAAESEQAALQARLETIEGRMDIPDALSRYKAAVMDLQRVLKSDITHARTIMRKLFGEIRVEREGDEVWAEVAVRAEHLMAAAGGPSTLVVAGARFGHCRRVRLQ
ncbi:MAG TPA: recombinase family protein [Burkholderiales bacterium]|nr:recombinase family protein [Burkholderiales bacterium]